MAITTLDGAAAGALAPIPILKVSGSSPKAAGTLHSLFYGTGNPGAAQAPTPGINGAALTTYGGQIPFINPAAGNTYLYRLWANANTPGSLILCDRLWHNSGLNTSLTTLQNIVSPTWPSRCPPPSSLQTAAPDTNGNMIMVGIEVTTATTNVGAISNTTLSYTDESGNSGATATISSFPATATVGTFVPFQLASGDVGVRSIQGITLGTAYGGAISLVAYRMIAQVDIAVLGIGADKNFITGGGPRLYDSSVPFLLWMPANTTVPTITGGIQYTQG